MDRPPAPDQPSEQRSEASDLASASQSTADYIKNLKPIKEAKRKRKLRRIILLVVVGLIVVAALGYGVYRFVNRSTEPEPIAQTTEPEEMNEPTTPLESFSSQTLGLKLEYPNDWTVDDATPNQINLTSPKTKLQDVNDTPTDAKAVITIRKNDGTLTDFDKAQPKAVRESVKFTYNAPSQNQRAETFLTFLSFTGSNGVEAIYITGDKGYQKGADIPKADVLLVEPTVKIQFYACAESACENAATEPLSIAPDAWGSNETLQAALQILQSLNVQ